MGSGLYLEKRKNEFSEPPLIRGKSAIYEVHNGATLKLGGASIAELPMVVI